MYLPAGDVTEVKRSRSGKPNNEIINVLITLINDVKLKMVLVNVMDVGVKKSTGVQLITGVVTWTVKIFDLFRTSRSFPSDLIESRLSKCMRMVQVSVMDIGTKKSTGVQLITGVVTWSVKIFDLFSTFRSFLSDFD
jgi:hypothetical protein